MTIAEILKDSNYKLTQFNLVEIQNLENRITTKEVRGNVTPYIKCLVRKKEIKLTPEEAVRQLYIQVLIDDYDYPVERMEIEYSVSFGREKKRADIVIFDKQKTTSPYIMVELKKPKLKDGKEQLKSYCNATGAPIGVWSNGDSISFYHRKLGEIAVAEEWLLPANMNRDVAIIKPLTNEFPSEYVALFMMSEYGALQSLRGGSGGVQQMITLERLRKFVIPFFSNDFSEITKALYNEAKNCRIESQEKYSQAENLLLEILGLKDFEPSKEPVNIKTFSESFGSSGRLDAEYYQPKYEEIEKKIISLKHSNLGDTILKINTGEYSPTYFLKGEQEGLTFYIRSTNIKGGIIEFDESYYVPQKDFIRFAKEGDIVTARVGSIGVFGEVRKELEGAVYSDNVLCFRLPKEYISSVYTLLFNTKVYFELIDRLARGSVQQRLNQETLKELEIPFIDLQNQLNISELIEESFTLKSQSEQLLELAKTAVEKAIEENEEKATNYINEKLTELKITIDHA